MAFHNGMVIPLLSEVLSDLTGEQPTDKQDCEQKAFRRLAQRLKEAFSHLPILLLLDGLYPNGPIIELCRQNHWDFMIVLQDDSLPSLWEEIQGLQKLADKNQWSQNWGNRRQRFRWFNHLEICLCRSGHWATQTALPARGHLPGKLGGNRSAKHRRGAQESAMTRELAEAVIARDWRSRRKRTFFKKG